MKNCVKCGNELPESGICATCGYSENNATPHEASSVNNPSPSNNNQNFTEKLHANPIVADSLTALKKTFTSNPQQAVIFASNSQSHVWLILGGLNILVTALAFIFVPGGLIRSIFGGFASSAVNNSMLSLFGSGLLLALVSFTVLSACVKGVYSIYKLNVPFVKVMNMVSSTFLISGIATAGAIIFSFVFVQVSILLILIGMLGSIILLYTSMQNIASFKFSPLWAFLCIYVIDIIAIYLIGGQMISSVLENVFSGLFGGFGGFGW